MVISFYTVYQIRTNSQEFEYGYFMFIFLICISTDLGGYIFGKLLKGPKISKISPNKTYAGMLGSFLLSISVVLIISIYSESFIITNKISLNLVLLIMIISIISQIGDFVISYFKRLSKKKNTGNLIPGHGGLLDRIDGMIFAFPFSYIIFSSGIINLWKK